jgi:esterase/lipase
MYKTKQMARAIHNTPVLIVHGQQDGESKPSGSEGVYHSLATKDKQYLPVADADHFIFEDVNVNEKTATTTISWIENHSNRR